MVFLVTLMFCRCHNARGLRIAAVMYVVALSGKILLVVVRENLGQVVVVDIYKRSIAFHL